MKPWQAILMVVALLVLGGSVAWQIVGSDKPEVSGEVLLVDIRTGQVFRANTSGRRAVVLPAKHPETGERSLYSAALGDDNRYRVNPRYLVEVREFEGELIEFGPDGEFEPSGEVRRYE